MKKSSVKKTPHWSEGVNDCKNHTLFHGILHLLSLEYVLS